MPDKLVRDLIPELIIKDGFKPKTRILSDEEYLYELDKKLIEEVNEYLEANDLDELCDIIEVIMAIADARGTGFNDIEQKRNDKLQKRGGFKQKIFLYEDK